VEVFTSPKGAGCAAVAVCNKSDLGIDDLEKIVVSFGKNLKRRLAGSLFEEVIVLARVMVMMKFGLVVSYVGIEPLPIHLDLHIFFWRRHKRNTRIRIGREIVLCERVTNGRTKQNEVPSEGPEVLGSSSTSSSLLSQYRLFL